MKSIQEIKWKPVFMETQKKACDFEAKGFLNNYVFSRPIQSSPHLRPNFEVCCSHAKAQKKFSGRKNEMKSQESLPTAIHIHGALHARKQPEAENQQNDRYLFKVENSKKLKIGIGIHKTISQTLAQRQYEHKGGEPYRKLKRPTNK